MKKKLKNDDTRVTPNKPPAMVTGLPTITRALPQIMPRNMCRNT